MIFKVFEIKTLFFKAFFRYAKDVVLGYAPFVLAMTD